MLPFIIKRLVFAFVITNLIASQAQIIGGLYSRFCNYVRLPSYCPNSFESLTFPPLAFAQTPSSASSPFTFPTIYTTNRPGSQPATTPAIRPGGPGQQMSQIPSFCPPFLTICPIGINTAIMQLPNIDPRLTIRQVNGCPCIDSRSPGLPQSMNVGGEGGGVGQMPPSMMPTVASFPNVPFTPGSAISPSLLSNQAVPGFANFGATPSLAMGNPSMQPFPSMTNALPAYPSPSANIPSQFVNGFPQFPSASFPGALPPNILLRSGDQIRT